MTLNGHERIGIGEAGRISIVEISRGERKKLQKLLAAVYPDGFRELGSGHRYNEYGLGFVEISGLKHRVVVAFLKHKRPEIHVEDDYSERAVSLMFVPPQNSSFELSILFQKDLCESLHGIVSPYVLEVTRIETSEGTCTTMQLLTVDQQGKRLDAMVDFLFGYTVVFSDVYGNTTEGGCASGGFVVLGSQENDRSF
jgi:hypothetical protein